MFPEQVLGLLLKYLEQRSDHIVCEATAITECKGRVTLRFICDLHPVQIADQDVDQFQCMLCPPGLVQLFLHAL